MTEKRFVMFYWLYSVLYAAALVVLLPAEYLKRPAELRKRWLRERFGFYARTRPEGRSVWIHAVSVGEVIASISLIKKIKQRHPLLGIILSTVTDTGQKVALEQAGAYAEIVYMPFDLPFAVKNAQHYARPSAFIIMETELWPNLIRMMKESKVPVVLTNGRLSEHSHKGYRKLGFFIREVLRDISLFCVQDDIYAGRFRSLGAAPDRIKVIGSFKFDTRPSSDLPEWTRMLHGPVVIAGSTHETEEDLALDAYRRLIADFPGLNLIIAPRHPARFREVEELVKNKGLEYVKRSEIASSQGPPRLRVPVSPRPDSAASGLVVILDVIGELSAVYGAADIAVMGGSFIEHGGQNPLEPAYWGKAIVCGPHMENFPFMGEFCSRGGAVRAEGQGLYNVLKELLASPEQMRSMGKIAKELYEKNAGATERAMELIEKYLCDK